MSGSSTNYDLIPAELAPAEPLRPRVSVVGAALIAAGVSVGYITLVALYVSERAQTVSSGSPWLPRGVTIPLTQPNFMLFTLAMSVVTAFWAVWAAGRNDRQHTLYGIGLTLLFGFAYVAQTFFLFEIMNMGAADDRRAILIYALMGGHIAIALAAIGVFAAVGLRAVLGEFGPHRTDGLAGAFVFWSAMFLLYCCLWYAVYITK